MLGGAGGVPGAFHKPISRGSVGSIINSASIGPEFGIQAKNIRSLGVRKECGNITDDLVLGNVELF
jgi:hypothetical protein